MNATNSSASTGASLFGSIGSAQRPTGKKVIGGGATVFTDGNFVQAGYKVNWDGPQGDNAWTAFFNVTNVGGATFTMTVYAICATVS